MHAHVYAQKFTFLISNFLVILINLSNFVSMTEHTMLDPHEAKKLLYVTILEGRKESERGGPIDLPVVRGSR